MVDKDGVLLFLHVVRKMSREVGQALQIPVMGPQVELLEILASRGAQKMSDLAAELGISLGAVTALADRMARAGMIERQRSTSDRRVILLVLTEHGNRILEEISETRSLVMGRYFGKLTEAEMAQMEDLCRKMLAPLPHQESDNKQQRETTSERQTTPEGGAGGTHDNHRRRS
ncbi:MarR family winged helix-turn-helix transcriptional regulator [Alicyclobacillus mengziensis]|uniref:MarR family transcriptional regulator n=1 Tax=Alicyclobacillus mengziensis TaxID=2931921 RepID=A0A9X7W2X4_9BACL|nr:MarR family transcriptional regulator [Alicyclobacillus mengziensis]QSO48293.1 MarR family transcriptional regulator [Alicyclobacillus mengziensis]